jgi:hypothetical protein
MRHRVLVHRAGKSLIEMLMLISTLSVILATVATMLIALMKTDRQVRRDLEQQTTLARLAEKFRTDAHAATRCQVGPVCELTLTDGRLVRYEARPGQIDREVRRGDAVEHRDGYLLPNTAAVAFEQPAETGGRLVQLRISALPGSDGPYRTPIRPTLIEAALGLAHRPLQPEDKP